MGFLDAFSLGPSKEDVAGFEADRQRRSDERTRQLAENHTRAELEALLEERRELETDLSQRTVRETGENVDYVGDIMRALELQKKWGL